LWIKKVRRNGNFLRPIEGEEEKKITVFGGLRKRKRGGKWWVYDENIFSVNEGVQKLTIF